MERIKPKAVRRAGKEKGRLVPGFGAVTHRFGPESSEGRRMRRVGRCEHVSLRLVQTGVRAKERDVCFVRRELSGATRRVLRVCPSSRARLGCFTRLRD